MRLWADARGPDRVELVKPVEHHDGKHLSPGDLDSTVDWAAFADRTEVDREVETRDRSCVSPSRCGCGPPSSSL